LFKRLVRSFLLYRKHAKGAAKGPKNNPIHPQNRLLPPRSFAIL
jgi:hypothetical protein